MSCVWGFGENKNKVGIFEENSFYNQVFAPITTIFNVNQRPKSRARMQPPKNSVNAI
jgi:hypothetical protein